MSHAKTAGMYYMLTYHEKNALRFIGFLLIINRRQTLPGLRMIYLVKTFHFCMYLSGDVIRSFYKNQIANTQLQILGVLNECAKKQLREKSPNNNFKCTFWKPTFKIQTKNSTALNLGVRLCKGNHALLTVTFCIKLPLFLVGNICSG